MLSSKVRVLFLLVLSLYVMITEQKSLKDFPEECFTAKTIYDETRIFGTFHEVMNDDLQLRKGWYRFSGRSANSLKEGVSTISPHSDALQLCGAMYPGTLMSSHPTVEEGMVSMVACFRTRECYLNNGIGCKCKSKRHIYVRNCLRHYIYWLVPTARHERYCTSRTWLSKPGKSITVSDAIECNHYKVINDKTRLWDSISRITSESEAGWVRFGKESGGEIATQCTISSQKLSQTFQPCGANFRGWMNGEHPDVADGRVMRQVCFSYPDQCSCEVYSNIAVRNCSSYYVYYLQTPPVKNARYCGSQLESHSIRYNTNKSDNTMKNICNTSKNIEGVERLWSNADPTVSMCDASLYGIYHFSYNDIPFVIKEGCNKTDMLVVESRCATKYQGFIEGRHPTVNEGYVERIICFQYNRVPCECHATITIGIQNCGDSFVYDLKGVPICDARFCLEVHPDKEVDSISQTRYGSSSSYEPILASPKADTKNEITGDINLTFLLLGLILLFLVVLLIVLIVVAICIVRPLVREQSKEKPVDSKE